MNKQLKVFALIALVTTMAAAIGITLYKLGYWLLIQIGIPSLLATLAALYASTTTVMYPLHTVVSYLLRKTTTSEDLQSEEEARFAAAKEIR